MKAFACGYISPSLCVALGLQVIVHHLLLTKQTRQPHTDNITPELALLIQRMSKALTLLILHAM